MSRRSPAPGVDVVYNLVEDEEYEAGERDTGDLRPWRRRG
jgi:hypothetical protein